MSRNRLFAVLFLLNSIFIICPAFARYDDHYEFDEPDSRYDEDGWDKDGFNRLGMKKRDREFNYYDSDEDAHDKYGFNQKHFKSFVPKARREPELSFFEKANKLGTTFDANALTVKQVKAKQKEAHKYLKEIGSWFGVKDANPKRLYRQIILHYHPDHCGEQIDMPGPRQKDVKLKVVNATTGKGFPDKVESRCTDVLTLTKSLLDILTVSQTL
jgi:hypothetical protein